MELTTDHYRFPRETAPGYGPPPRTAQWLIWMFERGLYQLIDPADDHETQQLHNALTNIVWRIIYRQ